jgi:hypothetical protein
LEAALQWDVWRTAPPKFLEKLSRDVARRLGSRWQALPLERFAASDFMTASFKHRPSGLVFRLVPGGTFLMGWTQRDECTFQRLQAEPIAAPAEQELEEPVLAPLGPIDVADPKVLRMADMIDRAFGVAPGDYDELLKPLDQRRPCLSSSFSIRGCVRVCRSRRSA